jgi:hypothetical protein
VFHLTVNTQTHFRFTPLRETYSYQVMGPRLRFPRETQSAGEADRVQPSNNQSHSLARTHPSSNIKYYSVIAQDSSIADHSPNGERKPPRESSPGELSPPLTKAEMWNVRRHLFTNGQEDVPLHEHDWGELHQSVQARYTSYISNTPDNPEMNLEPCGQQHTISASAQVKRLTRSNLKSLRRSDKSLR